MVYFLATSIPQQVGTFQQLSQQRVCSIVEGATSREQAVFMTSVCLADLKTVLLNNEWNSLLQLLNDLGFPPQTTPETNTQHAPFLSTTAPSTTQFLINTTKNFDSILTKHMVTIAEYAHNNDKKTKQRLTLLFTTLQTILMNKNFSVMVSIAQNEIQETSTWRSRAEMLSHTIGAKLADNVTKKIAWDIGVDARVEREVQARNQAEIQLGMVMSRSQISHYRINDMEKQLKEMDELKGKLTAAKREIERLKNSPNYYANDQSVPAAKMVSPLGELQKRSRRSSLSDINSLGTLPENSIQPPQQLQQNQHLQPSQQLQQNQHLQLSQQLQQSQYLQPLPQSFTKPTVSPPSSSSSSGSSGTSNTSDDLNNFKKFLDESLSSGATEKATGKNNKRISAPVEPNTTAFSKKKSSSVANRLSMASTTSMPQITTTAPSSTDEEKSRRPVVGRRSDLRVQPASVLIEETAFRGKKSASGDSLPPSPLRCDDSSPPASPLRRSSGGSSESNSQLTPPHTPQSGYNSGRRFSQQSYNSDAGSVSISKRRDSSASSSGTSSEEDDFSDEYSDDESSEVLHFKKPGRNRNGVDRPLSISRPNSMPHINKMIAGGARSPGSPTSGRNHFAAPSSPRSAVGGVNRFGPPPSTTVSAKFIPHHQPIRKSFSDLGSSDGIQSKVALNPVTANGRLSTSDIGRPDKASLDPAGSSSTVKSRMSMSDFREGLSLNFGGKKKGFFGRFGGKNKV